MHHTHEHHNHPHAPQRPGGRRHRRDEFGFGPGGFGPPGFGRGPRGGRRRMRRGDVRAAILVLLDEQSRNGYQLMQEIEERSEGAWRPSPGSVYPALQQLEDEGLVSPEETDGRKAFVLTEDGVTHVNENREKLGEPWNEVKPESKGPQYDFWMQLKPLVDAAKQVSQVGDDATLKRGAEVLAEARRQLYAILAEDRSSS